MLTFFSFWYLFLTAGQNLETYVTAKSTKSLKLDESNRKLCSTTVKYFADRTSRINVHSGTT